MRLLFVAADPREFTGILAHAVDARPVSFGVKWSRTARVGPHETVLAANGVGWKRAAMAVDRGVEWAKPDAVVSTGFCGALADELAIADIVLGTGILGPGREYRALPLKPARPCRHGKVASIDHVAQTSAEKRRLGASGACAVEMEAAAVAERTDLLGLPFYCVRAVTDLAGEDLANDFNAALRSEGHFDTMNILSRAFHQPAVRLPELWRLRSRSIRAARSLGEFFADCGF